MSRTQLPNYLTMSLMEPEEGFNKIRRKLTTRFCTKIDD